MVTSILLASPREPSGGSWLVNCLLELGVRVSLQPTVDHDWRSARDRQQPSAMWQPTRDGGWRLNPRAEGLKKWLPILGQHEALYFRNDAEVLYVQDLPRVELAGARTVLFVRDPRDAIHSLYRRNRPSMSLEEFVGLPHPETLLDAIGHWRLFVESWLALDGALVYRFEDYKADAEGLLTRIVSDLGLAASPVSLARAAAESTFEKARGAEERYHAAHPRDEEVAMRAGQVGEWMTSPDPRELSREIERRIGPLLMRLGYDVHAELEAVPKIEGISHLHFLTVFERINLPPDLREAAVSSDPMACPRLPEVLRFASTVDAHLIRRARLHPRDARTLLDSLQEYVTAWQDCQRGRLQAARAEFDDGGAYHMTRIRELMASRREATPSGPVDL